jgi:RNA polymerase sigma factor (sigma-70 family)
MCKNKSANRLIEENLDVVKGVIFKHIDVRENLHGFAYDDLFQEGCVWLCKAAATYNPKTAKFRTYAKAVVKNGLISYCRKMYAAQKRFARPEGLSDAGDGSSFIESIAGADTYTPLISQVDTLNLLESVKLEYNGIARKGIEALEWKIKGYSGSEIAQMYGVKPNLVGAWISRAAQKLRQNERFMALLE